MAEDPPIGKIYRGQQHAPLLTPEMAEEINAVQREYDHPDAMPVEAYFSLRGIKEPARVAGMLAYTKVRRATVYDWDLIFRSY